MRCGLGCRGSRSCEFRRCGLRCRGSRWCEFKRCGLRCRGGWGYELGGCGLRRHGYRGCELGRRGLRRRGSRWRGLGRCGSRRRGSRSCSARFRGRFGLRCGNGCRHLGGSLRACWARARGQARCHGRRQARRDVFISVERRVFEPGFHHEEDVGFYFAAAIILVELRQDFPGSIGIAVHLIVHGGQEFFSRTGPADQGVQPGKSGAFTAHPRLRPFGLLTSCGHTTFSRYIVMTMSQKAVLRY